MASGGSAGRSCSGSRSFDFGADDVLCSYDDMDLLQEQSNGKRTDASGSGKDFRENRAGRQLQNVYCQEKEYCRQDVISAVEKCMKKYADNLLSVLDGISGRLSQLEVYCYNIEKLMEEFRSDLAQDQNEADLKLKSLEKHLQEVHRSVQILRDKQELDETQKELAKLQLAQKVSPEASSSSPKKKRQDDTSDTANKQLALALPQQAVAQAPALPPRVAEQHSQQVAAQQPAPSVSMQQPPYTQGGGFYTQQNQPPPHQLIPQPDARYMPQIPQPQELSAQPQQQQPPVVNQTPPFSHYQQQWPQQTPQQFPQPVSQPQQNTPQSQYQSQPQAPQATPQVQYQPQPPQTTPQVQYQPQVQGPPVYPPYQSPQTVKASPEIFQGSIPMPVVYSPIPPPGGSRQEVAPFGYGGPGAMQQSPLPPPPRNMEQQPQPPSSQGPLGQHLNKSSYAGAAPYPPHSTPQGYMPYGTDGSRTAHSHPYPPGSYPPAGIPPQHPTRGHPFGELIEKAVSMGYPRDQIAAAIYRMEETGQPVDFNALLDMLNSRNSVASQRGWSG